jgi:AcrR family transcriptional regulator
MARGYRQTKRATASAETEQRIVDATIQLHMTVGPARTTISAIAERAGVERLTVYRHFPDPNALLRRCTADGWARFPPPDPRAWAKVTDPEKRLETALTELYEYYDLVGEALAVILRDLPLVPALAALNAPHLATWDSMREVLERGWNRRGRRRRATRAAIALSLELTTWEALVRRQRLEPAEAVELLVRAVRCA